MTDLTIKQYVEQRRIDALNNEAQTGDDSYAATRYRAEARAYKDVLDFLAGTYRQEYLEAVADRAERRRLYGDVQ